MHIDEIRHRPITDLPLMTYDLETTGLDRERDRILEFGACVFRLEPTTYTIIDSAAFACLVRPGVPITPGASRINGIEEAHLEDAVPLWDGWHRWGDFLERWPAVGLAHNARDFDLPFLRAQAIRVATISRPAPAVTIDTLELLRYIRGKREGNALDRLVHEFDLSAQCPTRLHHRAGEDARRLALVFREVVMRSPTRWRTLADFEAAGCVVLG
jgi:DNA polymerase III alpha subunit (gram-positive type)